MTEAGPEGFQALAVWRREKYAGGKKSSFPSGRREKYLNYIPSGIQGDVTRYETATPSEIHRCDSLDRVHWRDGRACLAVLSGQRTNEGVFWIYSHRMLLPRPKVVCETGWTRRVAGWTMDQRNKQCKGRFGRNRYGRKNDDVRKKRNKRRNLEVSRAI
nr:hypothetical protein L204_03891 [Cryptococcus depauperatus CBS 7855]